MAWSVGFEPRPQWLVASVLSPLYYPCSPCLFLDIFIFTLTWLLIRHHYNCGGVDEVVFIDVFVCFCCCRILSSQQLMATMCVSLPMDKQALEKHILLTRSKIIHTVSDLFFLMSPGKRRLGKVRTNGTDDCPMITGGLATPESSDSSDLSIYGQLIRNYN